MAKLAVQINGKLTEFPLGSFTLSIGRRPDNNVVLDDPTVSGRHAVVGFDKGRYYVEDQKSSNGTHLNGVPVQRATLNDGDVLLIGASPIRFSDELQPTIQIPQGPAQGAATPAATGEAALLDELIGSIRSHRDREHNEREAAVTRVLEDWQQRLKLAEQLKARIAGDPRVKYFGIDRRAQDVLIRIQRSASSPPHTLLIALRHPDYRDQAINGIWLIRTGEPDRCLPSAQALGAELVRDLAFLLA